MLEKGSIPESTEQIILCDTIIKNLPESKIPYLLGVKVLERDGDGKIKVVPGKEKELITYYEKIEKKEAHKDALELQQAERLKMAINENLGIFTEEQLNLLKERGVLCGGEKMMVRKGQEQKIERLYNLIRLKYLYDTNDDTEKSDSEIKVHFGGNPDKFIENLIEGKKTFMDFLRDKKKYLRDDFSPEKIYCDEIKNFEYFLEDNYQYSLFSFLPEDSDINTIWEEYEETKETGDNPYFPEDEY